MNIRYIGSHDAVELPDGQIVARGETVSVHKDLAGSPPAKRLAEAMAELVEAIAAIDHDRAAALREEIIGIDAGSGLLAQDTSFEPVKVSAKEATS